MSIDRRQHTRVKWGSPGHIQTGEDKAKRFCLVSDLSDGGAKLTLAAYDLLPDEFTLHLAPAEAAKKCQVVWRSKGAVGVEFA